MLAVAEINRETVLNKSSADKGTLHSTLLTMKCTAETPLLLSADNPVVGLA
jgi:hypothetical protein